MCFRHAVAPNAVVLVVTTRRGQVKKTHDTFGQTKLNEERHFYCFRVIFGGGFTAVELHEFYKYHYP